MSQNYNFPVFECVLDQILPQTPRAKYKWITMYVLNSLSTHPESH